MRRILAELLQKSGFEIPIRNLYYRLFGRWLRRTLSLGGLTARFLTPTAASADELLAFGGERDFLAGFLERLPSGVAVWDVGSNIGLWTLFSSAKVGEHGRVIAFEPNPDAARALQENARLNSAGNILLIPHALGSETRSASFFLGTRDSQTSGLLPQTGMYPTSETGVDVQMMRGEDVLQRGMAPPPFAAKIDVEGSELSVLRGFGDRAWAALHLLAIEIHPPLLDRQEGTVGDVEALLREKGFETVFSGRRRTELHWLCWKP